MICMTKTLCIRKTHPKWCDIYIITELQIQCLLIMNRQSISLYQFTASHPTFYEKRRAQSAEESSAMNTKL
jgi:hypothetical protein